MCFGSDRVAPVCALDTVLFAYDQLLGSRFFTRLQLYYVHTSRETRQIYARLSSLGGNAYHCLTEYVFDGPDSIAGSSL